MGRDESVTDYVIRAETASTSLKTVVKMLIYDLLIEMVLKGLAEFKAFSTVIVQKEKQVTFSEFKIALRNFEDMEKSRQGDRPANDNSVMKTGVSDARSNAKPKCFSCGMFGHKNMSVQIKSQVIGLMIISRKDGVLIYKSATHDTMYCRKSKSNSSKSVKASTK